MFFNNFSILSALLLPAGIDFMDKPETTVVFFFRKNMFTFYLHFLKINPIKFLLPCMWSYCLGVHNLL